MVNERSVVYCDVVGWGVGLRREEKREKRREARRREERRVDERIGLAIITFLENRLI